MRSFRIKVYVHGCLGKEEKEKEEIHFIPFSSEHLLKSDSDRQKDQLTEGWTDRPTNTVTYKIHVRVI